MNVGPCISTQILGRGIILGEGYTVIEAIPQRPETLTEAD